MTHHNWNPFFRFPRASLLLTLILCLPMLARLGSFKIRSESDVLLEGDQRNLASYQKVKQILADANVLVVSMELPEVFSSDGLESIRQVSDRFAALPGVLDVKSLTHSSKPVRKGLSFEMVPLVPAGPFTPLELSELKTFALEHPLVRNVMVAEDAKHTIIMVTFQRELSSVASQDVLRREVDEILNPFRQSGLRFQTLALPLTESEVRATLRSDIVRMIPVALLLMLIVLVLTFRSWWVVGLVLINLAVTMLILPAFIELLGFSFTVFSVLLLPLMAAIHLTLLAHVYTSMQRQWADGLSGKGAVEAMLHEVFKSCAFAGVTSAVGLLSFLLTDLRPVREFGVLSTAALGLVFAMSFGPGISLLQILPPRLYRNRRPISQATLPETMVAATVTRWIIKWRQTILALAAASVVIAVAGIVRMRTDIRAVEFLSPRSPTRQAVEQLDQIYGGINIVQIELDAGAPNGVNSRAFLDYVNGVEKFAAGRAGVSAVYSYAQLLAMMNQIWEGGNVRALKLPDSPVLVNLFVTALRSYDFPFLTALADPEFRVSYLVLRTRDMPAERYLEVLASVVNYAVKTQPPGVTVSAAKGIHSILEADRRIVRGQVSTAGSTVIIVGIVLGLLWRSTTLGFLSLVTNAVPIGLVIGMAGYCDVPLNSITIMVAAISFGIAVDDSVHFITFWRDLVRRGEDPVLAVTQTFHVKGKAIVVTSLALMVIFFAFSLSSFPPVVHFGWLSVAAFGGALIAVILLLPALLLSPIARRFVMPKVSGTGGLVNRG